MACQIDGLAVGQIAAVQLPGAVGQRLQTGEPFDHGAGLRLQVGGDLAGFLSALGRGAARKQERSGKNQQESSNTITQLQNANHGRKTSAA